MHTAVDASRGCGTWSLARFGVIAEFELKALWATKSTLVGQLFVEPLVYTALLAAGLQGLTGSSVGADGLTYLTFAFPGILGLQAIRLFARSVYRSTVDRRWGLLALKRLAGVGPLGYVLAMTVAPIAAFVVQALVATPVAILLDAEVSFGRWVGTVVLGAAFLFFWTGFAIALTAYIRNYEQRDLVISLSLLPLTFSAPVFYSLDDLPRYMQIVGYVNPLSYQVIAMRSTFVGHTEPAALLVALLTSVLLVVVATLSVARGELLGSEV